VRGRAEFQGEWKEGVSWEVGNAAMRRRDGWRGESVAQSVRRRRAGRAERVEHLGDDGRVGEHGADGELSAATHANAKVDVEGSFQKGTPSETRARSVELAFEDSRPVGERYDVRREVLGEAARRQRSRREEGDIEREGRATVARFARRPRRRRRRRRRRGGGTMAARRASVSTGVITRSVTRPRLAFFTR